MTTQRVPPAIGDPAEFLNRQLSFKKSCDFYSAHYPQLLQRFPEEWIAIDDGEVRGHAGDLQQLLSQIDALGVPRSTTLVELLETNPTPKIL